MRVKIIALLLCTIMTYLTGIPNSFHRHHVKMNQNKKHQFKKRLNKNWSKSKLNIIFLGM